MRNSNVIAIAGIGLACAALVGCGYRTDEYYRPSVETVYVDMLASKEFRRDLEFKLVEALKKRINADTPYRLAPRETADTILTGEVLEERQNAFAPDYRTRFPREKQLTLAVRVQWKDLRSGKILVDQPVQLQTADYVPPTGETEAFAQEKVIDRLAQRIIAKMSSDW